MRFRTQGCRKLGGNGGASSPKIAPPPYFWPPHYKSSSSPRFSDLPAFLADDFSDHCQEFADAPSINRLWEMVLKKGNINTPKNTYLNCFEYSWRIMSHNIHCLMQWVIWYWYLFYNIRVPLLFFPLIPLQPGTMLNPSFLLVGLLSLVGLTWAFREPK